MGTPESAADSQQAQGQDFKKVHYILFAFVFLAGLALRWTALDVRPVHHDESLHLMYGRYFFDWPDFHFYKYDPMLHGPLLYNLLRFVYLSLGSTVWAGRALVCLLGSLMMFAPLLFRRYFRPNTLLGLTTAVALSPTLIYWSRFIREDNLQLFAMLICLAGVLLARDKWKGPLVLLGFALQFCEKENAYVTVAILLGYLIFERIFNQFVHHDLGGLVSDMWRYLKRYWSETFVGFGLAALLYSYLFSAGFRFPEGILDGLYRKSIAYWVNQHNIERISGPFMFHFYVLSWYELLFMVAVVAQFIIFYKRATKGVRRCGVLMLSAALSGALLTIGFPEIKDGVLLAPFRLKNPLAFEVFGVIVFLVQPLLVTIEHLWRKQQSLAFWGYLFWASLFTYSFLGEKVPWLSVYPFTAGLVYLALYYQDFFASFATPLERVPWRRVLFLVAAALCALGLIFVMQQGLFKEKEYDNVIFLVGGILLMLFAWCDYWLDLLGEVNLPLLGFTVLVLFNLRAAILVNFVYAGKANEFISQVHTTPEFHSLALRLRQEISNPLSAKSKTLLGMEDSTWPLTWYMVDMPNYRFSAPKSDYSKYDYIMKNWVDGESAPPGYNSERITLRGWWLPEYSKMTVKNFLNYSINHVPWNETGFAYLWYWAKADSTQ